MMIRKNKPFLLGQSAKQTFFPNYLIYTPDLALRLIRESKHFNIMII